MARIDFEGADAGGIVDGGVLMPAGGFAIRVDQREKRDVDLGGMARDLLRVTMRSQSAADLRRTDRRDRHGRGEREPGRDGASVLDARRRRPGRAAPGRAHQSRPENPARNRAA